MWRKKKPRLSDIWTRVGRMIGSITPRWPPSSKRLLHITHRLSTSTPLLSRFLFTARPIWYLVYLKIDLENYRAPSSWAKLGRICSCWTVAGGPSNTLLFSPLPARLAPRPLSLFVVLSPRRVATTPRRPWPVVGRFDCDEHPAGVCPAHSLLSPSFCAKSNTQTPNVRYFIRI
jgi:hypothetical protein